MMERNFAVEYRVRLQREQQVAENVREMEDRRKPAPQQEKPNGR